MSTNDKNIRESFLDAAATQAVGAHTAEESRTFGQELAAASAEEQREARDLTEAAARLAAASPYMSPAEGLRSRILAATAPVNFKMEDYRKAMRDDSRVWRWAVIAATLFLVAAAYWNLNLQSKNANLVAAVQARDARFEQVVKQLQGQVQGQSAMLNILVDKDSEQITLRDSQNNKIGRAFVDASTKRALVLMPEQMIHLGRTPVLTIEHDGKREAFETIVMGIHSGDTSTTSGVAGPVDVSNVLPNMGAVTPRQAKLIW